MAFADEIGFDGDAVEDFADLIRSMDSVYLARGDTAGKPGEPQNKVDLKDRRGFIGLLQRLVGKKDQPNA